MNDQERGVSSRLDRMEAAARAERLRRSQAYGTRRSAERGISVEDIQAVVDRVLHPRGGEVEESR